MPFALVAGASPMPSALVRRNWIAYLLLVIVAGSLVWTFVLPGGPRPLQARQDGPPRKAPELDGGVAWLNTAGPVKLSDLKGKVVLLDFWTFCCINCIHTLPDLARLEKKYEKELVVVGVHSAKFENEKVTENIRKAMLRYGITHPVVNDADHKIRARDEVNSWPTLVLIDPEGNLYKRGSGEGLHDAVDNEIGK